MNDSQQPPPARRWAYLRFAIIGRLLAGPPRRGGLKQLIRNLAEQSWEHPTTGAPVRFAFSTIERWYYAARKRSQDPVSALRRKTRRDQGHRWSVSIGVGERLRAQHREHPSWSYQLHYDNLVALHQADPSLGKTPSYSSVRRSMQSEGLVPKPRVIRLTSGAQQAIARLEQCEVRSYEVEHVNGLWHCDFHHGSRPVLTASAEWVNPIVLAIIDDRSRLVCHIQWYLAETAQVLVHGLCQAFLKHGLPGSLMSDNGSAMVAEETEQGLRDLGVVHDTTLPYSPYQNGKQESFWGQLEGRLLPMLESCHELTLAQLNEATQAWCEFEYNRKLHTEIATTPLERYFEGSDVARPCPPSETLRQAFCLHERRRQRKSDGTISLAGKRFEVPARFRHLKDIAIRFARWDLSRVHIVDPNTDVVLDRLYPLDKARNADGQRRAIPVTQQVLAAPAGEVAPLLKKLLADYAATGRPPAYIPLHENDPTEES